MASLQLTGYCSNSLPFRMPTGVADIHQSKAQIMVKAVRIHAPGGPEAMVYEDVEVGQPGEGQLLIRQTAIGVNFLDVYHRSGAYPLATMPATIGMY